MMTPTRSPSLRRRLRGGSVATYVALSLPVIGGMAAIGVEFVYVQTVRKELQGVADASAHAASLYLDGTQAGMDAALQHAQTIAAGLQVNGHPYLLAADDLEFGYFDTATLQFTPSSDPVMVDTARVQAVERGVGLGLGSAFFGRRNDVVACGAVMQGPGDASTGEYGGPGIENGHFDVDTTAARAKCAGTTECNGTTKHTHQYDDKFDVVEVDLLAPLDGHLALNGCVDSSGKLKTCGTTGAIRVVPSGQTFKISVVNADLSAGVWISINGVEYPVTEYDDTPFASLPSYSLDPLTGATLLTELSMRFDLRAIANCELIPSVTSNVKANELGIDGEWRAGALTVQAVTPTATTTAGRSAGDHDVVRTQNAGLLWESTYFWHWDGPAYTARNATTWQATYDTLVCNRPRFIDALGDGSGSTSGSGGGGGVCG